MEQAITTIIIITSIAAIGYLVDSMAFVLKKKKHSHIQAIKCYYPTVTKDQLN